MAIKHEDTVAGAALMTGGGVVVVLSLQIGTGAAGATLPPSFFPLLCSLGLIICGVILFVRGLISAPGPLPKLVDNRVAVVGALLFIFYWFFAWLDYRVAAFVLAFTTMWMFGIRSWVQLTVIPLGLASALYLAFTRGFNLVLPTWI